jgi:hypothetical protein
VSSRRDKKCAKRRFVNKDDAEAAVRKISQHSRALSVPQSAYYCRKCHGFHVSSWTMADYDRFKGRNVSDNETGT